MTVIETATGHDTDMLEAALLCCMPGRREVGLSDLIAGIDVHCHRVPTIAELEHSINALLDRGLVTVDDEHLTQTRAGARIARARPDASSAERLALVAEQLRGVERAAEGPRWSLDADSYDRARARHRRWADLVVG